MPHLAPSQTSAPSSARRSTNTSSSSEARIGIIALLALLTLGFWSTAAGAQSGEDRVRDIHLPVPLETVGAARDGGVYWSDTYGACRSGCARRHLGVDMIGPKMVPLLAAADGEISWMRESNSRGSILVITDADGWEYTYVHINNDTPGTDDGAAAREYIFAPGIEQGVTVKAGDVVAYLGDSGNAEATVPHLHFEIEDPDGNNINPTFSVDAALAAALAEPEPEIEVDPENLGPYETFDALVTDVFETFQGRNASRAEAEALAAQLTDDGFYATIEAMITRDSLSASVDRLYTIYFLRLPDRGGHEFWINDLAEGTDIVEISEFFATSDEFEERYGGKTFEEFLEQLYEDALYREPDSQGIQYWLQRLEEGSVTRGSIAAWFADSDELWELTEQRSELVALTALLEDRMPTDEEIEIWSAVRENQPLAEALVARLATEDTGN